MMNGLKQVVNLFMIY